MACGCHCVTLNNAFGTTAPAAICPISDFQITALSTPPVATGGLTWTALAKGFNAADKTYKDPINLPTGVTVPTPYYLYTAPLTSTLYSTPAMGNLTVEYYESACTNPSNHPADPTG